MESRGIVVIGALCALLMAVGLAATMLLPEMVPPKSVNLADVTNATLVEIRDHRGVAVLTGEFRQRVDMLGNVERDAALVDQQGNRVIGEVELETPAPDRTDRRPELEVDIIGLAPRAVFTVAIDDRQVGSFTTDDRGSVDMELQEGEDPAAPFRNGA
jgi:hypothetical protein